MDSVADMDRPLLKVFLTFLAYLLVVLVPLVPAVVTYKLFPKQQVGLSGPLAGLTINATGAFAAYVIVFLLAWQSMLGQILGALKDVSTPIWTVEGQVELISADGKPVPVGDLRPTLSILLQPPQIEVEGSRFTVKVPENPDGFAQVIFQFPGSFDNYIRIDRLPTANIERNIAKRRIKLIDPVVLREFGPAAKNQPYSKAESEYQRGSVAPVPAPLQ